MLERLIDIHTKQTEWRQKDSEELKTKEAKKAIEALQKDYEKAIEEAKKQLPKLREEINAKSDESIKIKAISTLDAKLSVPLKIKVLEDIQVIIFQNLEATFKKATQKTFKEVLKKEKVDDIFVATIGNTIKFLFEEIYLIKDIKLITPENTHEFIQNIVKNFFEAKALQPLFKNLDEETKQSLTKLLYTEIFVLAALAFYKEGERLLSLNTFWLIFEMATKTEDKLRKPYLGVIQSANNFEIFPLTEMLWYEFKFLLRGMHLHIYDKISANYKDKDGNVLKGEDGCFPTMDDEDDYLKSLKNITKYDFAFYAETLANTIDIRFQVYKQPAVLAEQVINAPSQNTKPVSAPPQPLQAKTGFSLFSKKKPIRPTKEGVVVIETEASIQIITTLAKTKVKLIEHINEINKSKLCTKREIVDDSVIPKELAAYADKSVEDKCNHLRYCIATYELTALQTKLLCIVPYEMQMLCGRYIKENENAWIFSSAHTTEAKDLLTQIAEENDYDFVTLVLGLLNLKVKLDSEPNTSRTLLPGINNILLLIFDYLRLGMNLGETSSNSSLTAVNNQLKRKSQDKIKDSVEIEADDEFTHIVTILSKDKIKLAKNIQEINEIKVRGKFQVKDESIIANYINASIDKEDKIRRFYICFNAIEFSQKQINILSYIPGRADIIYNQYVNVERSWTLWGFYYSATGGRNHSRIVNEELQIPTDDVLKKLDKLFNLQIVFFQDRSRNLWRDFNELLEDGANKMVDVAQLRYGLTG